MRLLASVLIILPAMACVPEDPGVTEPDVWPCALDQDCVGDLVCVIPTGATEGTCGEVGLDCNDSDLDTYFAGSFCPDGELLDCDDSDPTKYPGAPELCNGVSDDCDDEIDEELAPTPCPLTDGVCAGAVTSCVDGVPVDCSANCPGPDCAYGPSYVAIWAEAACDASDADCDGSATDGCPTCEEGRTCSGTCGSVAAEFCPCTPGVYSCAQMDCLDPVTGDPVVEPFDNLDVAGNGIDDDCSGFIDG